MRSVALFFFCVFSFVAAHGQIEFYKTEISVRENKLSTTKYFEVIISDRSSTELGDIDIQFGADEKLIIHEVRVEDSSGKTIKKYKEKDFVEISARSKSSFHSEDFVKRLTVRHNTFPYKVKYSYTIKQDEFLFVSHWIPVFGSIISKSVLEIRIPEDYRVQIKDSPELSRETTQLENEILYRWESGPILTRSDRGNLALPLSSILPRVIVVPSTFKYVHEGSSITWGSFGEWIEKLNYNKDVLTEPEIRRVDSLLAGVDDPRQKIVKLYKHLQKHTRYINVSLEKGGMNPWPASYVCEMRYGDCKALTMYMKALLKHVDIPSYYTLVYAGRKPVQVDPEFPSQQFNHVILAVPLDGDTIFLENTSSILPVGYVGSFTQNRKGLLVNGPESRLISIPGFDLDAVQESAHMHLVLGNDRSLGFRGNMTIKGFTFETLVHLASDHSKQDLTGEIAAILNIQTDELNGFHISEDTTEKYSIEVDVNGELKNRVRAIGADFAIYLPSMNAPKVEHESIPDEPIRIMLPINRSDSLVVELSGITGGNIELPKNIDVSSQFGQCSIQYFVLDGKAVAKRSIQIHAGTYENASRHELATFTNDFEKAQKTPIIIHTTPQ